MDFTSPPPSDEAPFLDWALWYASQGWDVFPCHGKVPIIPGGDFWMPRATKRRCVPGGASGQKPTSGFPSRPSRWC